MSFLAPPPSLHPHPYAQQRTNPKPSYSRNPAIHHFTLKSTTNTIDPTISWTSSISQHCRNGRLAEAAADFSRMRIAGVDPNFITFVTLLSGCAHFPSQSFSFGPSLHAYVFKLGLHKNNVKVGTAIVDMYSKCGQVDLAKLSFDEISEKNKVSWNTMLDGCMRNDRIEIAIKLFDEMPDRDAVSWTAMLGGFVKKGDFEQALYWFKHMQLSGVKPDYVTVISVLSACANLGALGLGLWIHRFVLHQDFNENIRIYNSLIDLYSRCGCIGFARQVFEKIKFKTLVSWNSIIVGFAINGYAEEALEFFNSMQKEGFEPDGVSFTGVLTACSHAGLVDEGLKLFDILKIRKISPTIEHYGCVVDLYSRAGRFEDALNVIKNMPMKPNGVILGSLLAACRTHGDVHLAERSMNYLSELDPGTDSNYVLLSNIYADLGSWDEANSVRKKMKSLGIRKKPGISSIEVECGVHEFVAGDKSHIETERIYEMLHHVHLELGLCGYRPERYVGQPHNCD